MPRFLSRLLLLVSVCLLGGCYYSPYGYYRPAYVAAYAAPVYGPVVVAPYYRYRYWR